MSERDYEKLKQMPRHAELMKWDKSDLAAHSMKYQGLCGEKVAEIERLKKENEQFRNEREIFQTQSNESIRTLSARNKKLREALTELVAWHGTGTAEENGAICETFGDAIHKAEAALKEEGKVN